MSLKTWISRENDNDEDISMLETQLTQAMDTLREHKVGVMRLVMCTCHYYIHIHIYIHA